MHAPTPTDEPLGLPALLLASFPLSPDRRHVAPGPLTDFLVERAADAYAGLLPGLAPGPGLLDLVPGPVGRGELDARLARAIVARLPERGVPARRRRRTARARSRPRDAVLLGGAAPRRWPAWLAPVLPGLVDGPARHPALAVLGVRRLPLAELADLLAAARPGARLVARPVRGAGRTRRPQERASSARCRCRWRTGGWCAARAGCCCRDRGLEHAGPAGGARAAGGRARGGAPAAGPARRGRGDAAERARGPRDPRRRRRPRTTPRSRPATTTTGRERVADAVLGLVAALDAEPGEYPWLADLALPGDDGDWYPAGELLLPGSQLAGVLAADAPFGTVEPGPGGPLRRRALAGGRRAVLVRPADGGRRGARRVRHRPGPGRRRGLGGRHRRPAAWRTADAAAAAASRGRVHRRPRPRPGRPRPLAAGAGAAGPSAAAGGAGRAGPGSGCPTAVTPTCRRTRPGGCAVTWCSTVSARATCAGRTPTRCWPGCTTRWSAAGAAGSPTR